MPHGYTPKKGGPTTVQLTVRVPARIEKKIRIKAKKANTSFNAALTEVLEDYYGAPTK